MKRLIGFLLLIGIGLSQGTAWAVLIGAGASPSRANVAFNRPASVSVTWTVNADPGNPGPVTATSGFVQVADPSLDTLFGTIPRALSRTIAPGGTATITETVVIPRSVLQAMERARNVNGNPFASFVLVRSFTDDNAQFVTASVNLYLTGGSSTVLQLDRLSLYFDDLSTVRLAARDEALTAQLDIAFSGAGQLRGVWELATPASTVGEPIFGTLRLVRQSLVGNQTTRLTSPALPTGQEGVYLLRFRVTEPDTGFEPVYVRYVVTQAGTPQRPALNVRVLAPGEGELLAEDTQFAWRADADAAAWQLEIYKKPAESAAERLPDLGTTQPDANAAPRVEGPPVTGMLVTGEARATGLSKLVRQHLEPGQGYWWRVRAIGDDGSVIGESPLVGFRSP